MGRGSPVLDTAPHYGIGDSERRFGEFLRGKPRDEYTLSTKVGRLLVPQDAKGRWDEHFEVPATHRRVWDFSRVDAALRYGYPALAELRSEATVGAVGAGMSDPAKLTKLVQETDADVVMLAGRYTFVCEAHGVTLPQAAIAFPLAHPVVAGVVMGMRSATEVHQNLASFQSAIPPQFWDDLRTDHLIG